MNNKKVVVVGSSIAGAAISLLLGKAGYELLVIEKRKISELGGKLCANVVTGDFQKLMGRMGLRRNGIVKTKFKKANFLSSNSSIQMGISEYEIDRTRFIKEIIKKAERYGVKFNFETSFVDFKKEGKKYRIFIKRGGKNLSELCDILIGADGAASLVAKKSGLWQKRKFILFMQTKIKKREIKNLKLKKENYYIFLGKQYGYYAYVFPRKEYAIVGLGDCKGDIADKLGRFVKWLGIKKYKTKSAVVPVPKLIKFCKGRIFLVGDAAAEVKFSGGGIIPALKNAFALSEFITRRNMKEIKQLRKELFLQYLTAKFIMRCKNFDRVLEIAKTETVSEMIKNRDNSKFFMIKAAPFILRLLPAFL